MSLSLASLIGHRTDMSTATGLIGAAIAVVFFGSNFVPLKKFDTGDGIFFQWILCVGIWCVGLAVNIYQGSPRFEPIAMLGGIIWCTGNLMVVPIVARIGLSLGLLIWGGSAMIMGWASGVFGIGIKPQTDNIHSWGLNIAGVCVACLSLLTSMNIKAEVKSTEYVPASFEPHIDPEDALFPNDQARHLPLIGSEVNHAPKVAEEPVSCLGSRRLEGALMAMFAGCFFGSNFNPPQYVKDYVKDSSQEDLDYVFSHFCGIFAQSTFAMLVYCGIKAKNGASPFVLPDVILPGWISGIMWGIAQCGFFVANGNLDFVVASPLVVLGPGFVSAIWGVAFFREIRGTRNFLFLGAVFCLTATSAVLTVLSRG